MNVSFTCRSFCLFLSIFYFFKQTSCMNFTGSTNSYNDTNEKSISSEENIYNNCLVKLKFISLKNILAYYLDLDENLDMASFFSVMTFMLLSSYVENSKVLVRKYKDLVFSDSIIFLNNGLVYLSVAGMLIGSNLNENYLKILHKKIENFHNDNIDLYEEIIRMAGKFITGRMKFMFENLKINSNKYEVHSFVNNSFKNCSNNPFLVVVDNVISFYCSSSIKEEELPLIVIKKTKEILQSYSFLFCEQIENVFVTK